MSPGDLRPGDLRVAVRKWGIGWQWKVESYHPSPDGDPWITFDSGWTATRNNAIALGRRSKAKHTKDGRDGQWQIIADENPSVLDGPGWY